MIHIFSPNQQFMDIKIHEKYFTLLFIADKSRFNEAVKHIVSPSAIII